MSQDLTYIRDQLKDHYEIDTPFELKKNENVKVITLEKDEEYFYSGKYQRMLDNYIIIIQKEGKSKKIQLNYYHKNGEIYYKSRLFIYDNNSDCEISKKERKEYEEIIKTQQRIIDKMSKENIKYRDIINKLHEKNMKYESKIKQLINY